MKLATFRVDTPLGPFDRFGIVRLDGGAQDVAASARAGAGWVIDACAAYAAFMSDRGKANARIRADTFCPPDLNACVQIYGPSLDSVLEMSDWIDQRWGAITRAQVRGPGDETIAYRLDRVRLRPPMRVPVLRDFAAFEDHLQVTFGKMGLKIPREWYERPIAFKGNATSFIGHDEPLKWPQYTQNDYELELAAVLGLPARDVDVARRPSTSSATPCSMISRLATRSASRCR
jgi:Fumarylacetoacetate (FAA) hydrolase family